MNQTIENIKAIELARLYIQNYSYQEIYVKNVSGIFLENKASKYPLIRISPIIFKSKEEFIEDAKVVSRMLDEYRLITKKDDAKLLCIYFNGIIEDRYNDIISLCLKTNDDIIKNDIINKEYNLIINKFNINKYDNTNVFINNQNTNKANPLIKNFDASMLVKNYRFTNIFILLFLAFNFYLNFQVTNTQLFYYDLSIYSIFIEQLHQFYRILTGLFINQGLIMVFIITYYLYSFSKYIELKIGTKKTILFYLLGILSILLSMLFVEKGTLFIGSIPLVALVTGGYIGIILHPNERNLLKFNFLNTPAGLLMIVFLLLNMETAIITSSIALLMGYTLITALNLKTIKINRLFLSLNIVLILVMISARFLPYQNIVRDNKFEDEYFKYKSNINISKAKQEQDIINNYYDKIGAVNFNE